MKTTTRRYAGVGLALLAVLIFAAGAAPVRAAEPGKEKREMLSKHQTVAQFAGVSYHRCMGLTSLCPDQCGNSGDFASFRVLKYIAYAKPGQYGDPEQTEYTFQVEDNMKNPKAPVEIRKTVAALAKGDYVLLDWEHHYVTKDGSSSPERVIKKFTKLAARRDTDSSFADESD